MKISEIKKAARASLKDKWWSFAGLTFIMLLFSSIIGMIAYPSRMILQSSMMPGGLSLKTITLVVLAILYTVISFSIIPVQYGFYYAHLASAREDDLADPAHLFAGYRRFWFILGLAILVQIIVSFGFMMLIIPGIVMALAYSMWPFIAHDHPELTIKEVLERSRVLMQGHKGELFTLYLSFIGWFLLCIPTLGLGLFFLIPYIYMSQYHFYESIRYELDEEPEIEPVATEKETILTDNDPHAGEEKEPNTQNGPETASE
ncbi:MAG: DUF975 family protein [Bacteroidales bacterium]|nr:DUF975 family protein [Bacteroidales bacterium]